MVTLKFVVPGVCVLMQPAPCFLLPFEAAGAAPPLYSSSILCWRGKHCLCSHRIPVVALDQVFRACMHCAQPSCGFLPYSDQHSRYNYRSHIILTHHIHDPLIPLTRHSISSNDPVLIVLSLSLSSSSNQLHNCAHLSVILNDKHRFAIIHSLEKNTRPKHTTHEER